MLGFELIAGHAALDSSTLIGAFHLTMHLLQNHKNVKPRKDQNLQDFNTSKIQILEEMRISNTSKSRNSKFLKTSQYRKCQKVRELQSLGNVKILANSKLRKDQQIENAHILQMATFRKCHDVEYVEISKM